MNTSTGPDGGAGEPVDPPVQSRSPAPQDAPAAKNAAAPKAEQKPARAPARKPTTRASPVKRTAASASAAGKDATPKPAARKAAAPKSSAPRPRVTPAASGAKRAPAKPRVRAAAQPSIAVAEPAGVPEALEAEPTVEAEPAAEAQPMAIAQMAPPPAEQFDEIVLQISGLTKRFGGTIAADGISLDVRAGSFYGIVGPNGAGKTTTLSMVTGLLRPDAGTVLVHGIDVWKQPERAKRTIGVLPDALRLFDRLTGAQLLFYSGTLRGLDRATVKARSADLITAFGLEDATGRLVADYSAGMTKKIALAAAMIHSPRLLVLDEPFESVDPVSAANIIEILQHYVAAGGTVVLSSHGMDLIQRVCDQVAIVVGGRVLAAGTTDDVRGDMSLEDRFVELAGGRKAAEGMEWLHSFTD